MRFAGEASARAQSPAERRPRTLKRSRIDHASALYARPRDRLSVFRHARTRRDCGGRSCGRINRRRKKKREPRGNARGFSAHGPSPPTETATRKSKAAKSRLLSQTKSPDRTPSRPRHEGKEKPSEAEDPRPQSRRRRSTSDEYARRRNASATRRLNPSRKESKPCR